MNIESTWHSLLENFQSSMISLAAYVCVCVCIRLGADWLNALCALESVCSKMFGSVFRTASVRSFEKGI